MNKSFYLTISQKNFIQSILHNLMGKTWSYELPVLLLDQSWLKLEKITLNELRSRLPSDNSQESPEIVHYQYLVKKGEDPLMAIQECWHEFGIEDFHRALRNSWRSISNPNHGWTFHKYSKLINEYRNNIDQSVLKCPLIVLARPDSTDEHQVKWIM